MITPATPAIVAHFAELGMLRFPEERVSIDAILKRQKKHPKRVDTGAGKRPMKRRFKRKNV